MTAHLGDEAPRVRRCRFRRRVATATLARLPAAALPRPWYTQSAANGRSGFRACPVFCNTRNIRLHSCLEIFPGGRLRLAYTLAGVLPDLATGLDAELPRGVSSAFNSGLLFTLKFPFSRGGEVSSFSHSGEVPVFSFRN